MKKRILSILCVLCLIVGLLPTTAFAWTAPSNISVTNATYHSSGALASIEAQFYWPTASATSRLVLMTKMLNTTTSSEPEYGDFTDMGTYGSSFSSFDAVESYDETNNNTFGIVSSSNEASVQMSQTNTLKIEFAENEIPLTMDALYYVYLWTYYSSNYYPDNLICAIQVKDGTVQYAGATGRNSYDAFDYVVSQEQFDVTITSGANITKTSESGNLTQNDLTAPMTPVVFTANDGYYFPEEYAVDTVNGIRVVRNSETQITVEGAPTANASITLTAPTAKTFTVTYNANGGTGEVPNDDTVYFFQRRGNCKSWHWPHQGRFRI